MRSTPKAKSGRIFYGWYIFAICFLMVFFALGFTSTPRSLLLTAITEDLGISRSLYSLSDSVRFITKAVVDAMFGALIAKFGARKLIACGFSCLIGAVLVYSFATNVVMFYFGGFLLGIGLAWTTTTIVGHLVENWFSGNKGTIMGIILAANGLGGAAATQLINKMIYLDTETAGWRLSYRLVAIGMAIVAVITLLVVRNRPEEMGLKPLAIVHKKTKRNKTISRQWDGISFDEAKRKPYFYICCICIFLTGMVLQSIYGISSAHMKDCNVDPSVIANVLSISSLLLMVSKMSTGFVFDKFGLRFTMLMCSGCAVLAIICLAFVSGTATAYLYTIFSAFALPLETIMLPLISKDLFGSRSYSKIMGLFVAINTFGYAVGVPLMNLSFDIIGTYRPMMMVMCVVMTIVAVVMQVIITVAHKECAEVSVSKTT